MKKIFVYLILVLTGALSLKNCTVLRNTPPQLKPEMVFVEGGEFMMGDIFDSKNEDALPVHAAKVSDFYIGKYEVTYAQYDAFAKATNQELPKDRNYGRGERAVTYIDWHQALAFCKYWGWRLPNEHEWEYAARSGGKEYRYAGTSNPDSLNLYAITESMNLNFSYLVGSKRPNELGLYDMSGNVFEMIGSFYQYYSYPDSIVNFENSGLRIMRGGSFDEERATNQTFWRVGTYDLMTHNDVGFRCAISQQELDNRGLLNGFFNFSPQTP